MLIAYHNDPTIKAQYLERVRHDQLVKGQYWCNGKGYAVGCTIHSDEHDRYETELGIPTAIAYLEDRLFEGLPNERAMVWPEEFLAAIEPGADLSRVSSQFFIWLLSSELPRHFNGDRWPAVRDAVQTCTVLHQRAAQG
ncbi:MAG: hypothetical protein KGR26_09625, partial [Cyanobacteria bacterium REEB65]|nr:hypothetical protein [Cyanobacteria bacterium REEB65]